MENLMILSFLIYVFLVIGGLIIGALILRWVLGINTIMGELKGIRSGLALLRDEMIRQGASSYARKEERR